MTTLSQSSKFESQSQNSKTKTGLRERCYHYSIKAIGFFETLPEKQASVLSRKYVDYYSLSPAWERVRVRGNLSSLTSPLRGRREGLFNKFLRRYTRTFTVFAMALSFDF
jgi:hypothetical protein